MNAFISAPRTRYVGATSEGEAIAIAAGAWLAGQKTGVICQNSGLGNTVNPLTSLNYPAKIPTLLITTLRGAPGLKDESQHVLMGQITSQLLDLMRIPNAVFPSDPADIAPALEGATTTTRDSSLPYTFVLTKGAVAKSTFSQSISSLQVKTTVMGTFDRTTPPKRIDILAMIRATVPERTGLIATTGFCSRELFALGDTDAQFYTVGSMGCASAIGLLGPR